MMPDPEHRHHKWYVLTLLQKILHDCLNTSIKVTILLYEHSSTKLYTIKFRLF
jgi:hypothetical protein